MSYLTPSWMDAASGYSGSDDRRMLSAALKPGVVDAASLAVTQRAAGANLSVDVAAGTAFTPQGQGTEAIKRGWVCTNTAVVNLAISAAPGVGGQSRKDLVVVQVRDNTVDSGGFDDWYLRVVEGTAGTPGTQPSTPDHAYVLAVVTLTNGDTSVTNSNISDSRTSNNSRALSGLSESTAGVDAIRFNSTNQRPEILLSATGPKLENSTGLKVKLSTDIGQTSRAGSDLGLLTQATPDFLISNGGQAEDRHYYVPMGLYASLATITNSVGRAWPIMFEKTVTLATINFNTTSFSISQTHYFTLFAVSSASDGRPGSKIVDLGNVVASSTGVKTVTVGSPPTLTAWTKYYIVHWIVGSAGNNYTTASGPSSPDVWHKVSEYNPPPSLAFKAATIHAAPQWHDLTGFTTATSPSTFTPSNWTNSSTVNSWMTTMVRVNNV